MSRGDILQPVARVTTASIIADRIRGGITDGTFAPGTQLGEANLAQNLQVSRGPVREALQRLIQEGLLYNEPNRGVFVTALGAGDVEDVYLARGAVERAAVSVLVKRGDAKALAPLERLLGRMDSAARRDRWGAVADLDLQFHEALVGASGSARLVRMFSTLIVETRMCMQALEPAYPAREELVAEHRELFEALRAGDRSALTAIDRHFQSAVKSLRGRGAPDGQASASPRGVPGRQVSASPRGARSAGGRGRGRRRGVPPGGPPATR